jgi:hypothetical protein
MNLSGGKGRVAMIALLYAIVSGLLGVTILSAPMASSPGAGAHHLIAPPPRPVSTPDGAQPVSRPLQPSRVSASAARKPAIVSGTWTPLNSQPSDQTIDFFPGSVFLLTDGRVLAEDDDNIGETSGPHEVDWWLLTPDNTGSYINGTWSQAASPPDCPNGLPGASSDTVYAPLYYASAVLPDGRLMVIGGEYDFDYDYFRMDGSGEVWTDQGAIYDPVANIWTCVAPPSGWIQIGDAQSVVLPDGTFMVAHPFNDTSAGGNQVATLDASTNPPTFNAPFTPSGKNTADFQSDEEGWNLLPNGTVLTLEVWNSSDGTKTPALTYNSSTEAWTSAGNAPDPLVNTSLREIGPAMLRPDGTLLAEGATGFNDIFNTVSGTWSSGPSFPSISDTVGSCTDKTEQLVAADAPAALLPDGNVLIAASPIDAKCGGPFSPWLTPTDFLEFDGTNLTQVAEPTFAPDIASFSTRLLLLPTGQVMFTNEFDFVELYTPAGTPDSSSIPTITGSPLAVNPGGTNFQLTGTQFNGRSQAVAYGDDYQAATNYPLVRITNTATGHVFYARTHDHSTMAVATGTASVSTEFDIPAGIELGASTLVVVANGIASSPVPVLVSDTIPTATPTVTATPTPTVTATPTPTPTMTPTPGPGKLGVSPLTMTLKTTGDAAVTGLIEVKNKGTGPLSVTVTGPKHNPPFSASPTSLTVAPNSMSTVTVRFGPSKKGTTTDAIKIKSAQPKKSFEVTLTGKSK